MTLYARWTANNYTITLNKDSGTGGSNNQTVTFGQQIPSPITPPTKTGYTFNGYFTGTNGTGTQYYNAFGARTFTSNWNSTSGTTLYAYWTFSDGTYYIKNRYSNLYMDSINGSGSQVIQENFFGDSYQKWIVNRQSNGTYTIRPVANSNLYLDIDNAWTHNGTMVKVHTYTGHAAQKFNFERNAAGYFHILPSHGTNIAVDVRNE